MKKIGEHDVAVNISHTADEVSVKPNMNVSTTQHALSHIASIRQLIVNLILDQG